MNELGWVVAAVAVGAVGMLLIASGRLVFGPVDRRRLEKFALRQALLVTPRNGNTVIRYLATTRRWRGGLLYLTLVGSVAFFLLTGQALDVNVVAAFSGWFIGAVIAEWRVDSLARGRKSAALLHRRQLSDYTRRPALAIAGVLWLAAPVLAVIAVSESAARSVDLVAATVTLVVELAAGTIIVLVARRVLQRPQPAVAPDLTEADNAIRGRSLNVLIGSALAIGGYLGAASIGEIVARPDSPAVHLAQLIGVVALPILGVIVGRAPRMRAVGLRSRALAA